jgi:hypothetical protein
MRRSPHVTGFANFDTLRTMHFIYASPCGQYAAG